MADRSEFRFVVDGLALDDRQRERIGMAVQAAGLQALASVGAELDSPVFVGHANLKLNPEWYGLWVVNGELANEVGAKIEGMGFFEG